MKLSFLVTLAVSISCMLASVLTAQEPQMFRYQGRILDNDALVSGNLDFSFKLYDTPTGGSSLYEDAATIAVVDGLYSTMIGDDSTSGGDLGDALNNPAVYLEIEVGGETLIPRERIVSVPYAMNGLPSGSVVLSASNPNAALEAKGYSLVYSDVNSPEDWIVAWEEELEVPFDINMYRFGMVTFGSYVGFYKEMGPAGDGSNSFYYSQDGIFWNESDLPFYSGAASLKGYELNANVFIILPESEVGGPGFQVATTSNGADWTELSVSLPVSFSDIRVSELVVFANQIWLLGYSDTGDGDLLLKSSDGATWDAVATPAWGTMESLEILSTPDRLVVSENSGGTGTYVWSTTDGSTWSISNAALPFNTPAEGPDMAYANGALWTLGTPTGETFKALYKSTDWGNSWSQVTTNLPTIQGSNNAELMALAPSPGLFYAFGGGNGAEGAYISVDGNNWSKVSSSDFFMTMTGASDIDISSTGKCWIYGDDLHSIGGPLRNGRFFYYQKD